MSKSKKSTNPILKFFRELLVVVTGIGITVGTGLWVNKKNNEKDLKQYLTALKMELEQNAENFDWYANSLQKSVKYANYILSHDEKSVNQDTINYYMDSKDGVGWGAIQSVNVFTKNAFEMFKISGAMRQMGDKGLLMYVWEIYSKMENVQSFLDMCIQIKREERLKEVQLWAEGKKIIVPMKIFYSDSYIHEMLRECKDMSERIKQTISILEASKIFK